MKWAVHCGSGRVESRGTLRAAYSLALRSSGRVYQGDKPVTISIERLADGGLTLTARWAR